MRIIRQFLIFIFLTGSSTCILGQRIILEESTTANYWGYLNQMQAVQSSLLRGKVDPNLEVSSNFVLSDSLLNRLSRKFNKLVPADFFNDGVLVLDSHTKPTRQGQVTKYTYASIEKRNIRAIVDVIVTFEVHLEGEGIKFPKVLKIEVNSPGLLKLNFDNIIKEYIERKAEADKLPPPPRN